MNPAIAHGRCGKPAVDRRTSRVLPLSLQAGTTPKRILCLGAHCDDVEIGCAATLIKLVQRFPCAETRVCVFTGDERREFETRAAFSQVLKECRMSEIVVCGFRNGHFPFVAAGIKDHLETYKEYNPDLIFTHYRHDHHQDHRTISELTTNTFRDHLVLEYEILKYDGDIANPNVFVTVTREELDRKISILMDSFESQKSKQWFTPDTFLAMARIRGVHCASPTGFAEAFYANKVNLAF